MYKFSKLKFFLQILLCLLLAMGYVVFSTLFSNSLINKFSFAFIIPILLTLIYKMIDEFNSSRNTAKQARDLESLKELGIISEEEYKFRKNQIIELENERVKYNHKKDPEKYYKNIKEYEKWGLNGNKDQ